MKMSRRQLVVAAGVGGAALALAKASIAFAQSTSSGWRAIAESEFASKTLAAQTSAWVTTFKATRTTAPEIKVCNDVLAELARAQAVHQKHYNLLVQREGLTWASGAPTTAAFTTPLSVSEALSRILSREQAGRQSLRTHLPNAGTGKGLCSAMYGKAGGVVSRVLHLSNRLTQLGL